MRSYLFRAFLFIILLTPFHIAAPRSAAQSARSNGQPDQVVLRPEIRQEPGFAAGSEYLSPPTEAAGPFTHMLLRREAHVPSGAELRLFVRVSLDGAAWSDWTAVTENDDLWMPEDGPDVEWSQTIDAGAARFWQIRAEFVASPDGQLPELRGVDVNTVDTRAFAPDQPPPNTTPSLSAVGKPGVVSRTQWGNPDGQGSRVPPSYYPVNHLVVHHTADSSRLLPGESDWSARVRAEWSFHTYTRGWGDIGYNYLIDPNGVIYEGRAGGDDAVAFHDTANYGSMGVVIIGTYTEQEPSKISQNSLVSLLAWKAAQKNIDPLGSSYYYGCAISKYCKPFNPGAVVLNIAGHRQVTPGHTACPGDSFAALLPGIRNRVKQALSGGTPNNGDLEIDELESTDNENGNGFWKSDATWYSASCGAGGHTAYTYTTDRQDESSNRGRWRPNIPASGTYRVYAHIPQGCGLRSPPYASEKARYTISFAGGSATKEVDQNTSTVWVDLGAYHFDKGSTGSVTLDDLTGEPYANRRVLFFDAVKWVPENPENTSVELVDVRFDRTTIASGELLKATFTVKNTGSTTLYTQEPQAGTAPDGSFNDGIDGRPDNSYVYDEGECFIGDSSGSYSAFPKESNRFRVVLGPTDSSSISCAGQFGNYPWRWGLNGNLEPGATRTIIGYVRFHNNGNSHRTVTVQAGVIQEYVKYYVQGVKATAITITPERLKPTSASYDQLLQPLARVYKLGNVPDNFLARTVNPLSIPHGEYVGSFPWTGALIGWGTGGPLGLSDQFLVEQTRSFYAPVSGVYTFRTTTDDGSWLWVDGKPVVVNNGLHPEREITGTIELAAGVHNISFKYFERTGLASAEYAVQAPNSSSFTYPPDALGGGALRIGDIFAEVPEVTITSDDHGGLGIDRMRWSWDGVNWHDWPGSTMKLGKLANGSYRIRYQAVDKAGNSGDIHELAFRVNTDLKISKAYMPLMSRK